MEHCLKLCEIYEKPYKTVASELLDRFVYPWEVLPEISDFILTLGNTLPVRLYEKVGEDIWISKDADVSKSAEIHGPCIICAGAQIRHCAYIRGSAIVGCGCVVGNSTELKNCILFDGVQVPHYNYVGDSILGYKSHMGAGAVTSNIKSDKSYVTVALNGERIPTGRKKLGAILADYVEIGCNTGNGDRFAFKRIPAISCTRVYTPKPYFQIKRSDRKKVLIA